MRATITDGMNCIDVGCHLGSLLQRIVRLSPNGRHAAVEPIPYKADWLRKKFPAVDIHQLALGDTRGSVEFFYHRRRSAVSALRMQGMTDEVEKLIVDCKTLDDIVPPHRPIGFIKIDVEGAEYRVFRGARKLIAESRPLILFECTRSGLSSFGCTASQVYLLLARDLQYEVFFINDWLSGGSPLALAGFEASMIFPFKAFNYVAAPQR
jgi:FkbM family methyltransferase